MHHPTASFAISCLGQFQVLVAGVPARFATDQGRALLAYLSIEAGKPHARTYLAYLLWPDQSESQALNNLRQTLIRLRHALGMGEELAPILQITPKTLQFNANGARLDVHLFQQLLAQCKTHAHRSLEQCAECMQMLEQAAELYQGEFLQGLLLRHSQPFNEWATYVREELHHQAISVLNTLALFHEEQVNYAQARHYIARQLSLEPWQEEAHCQMMRVLAKSGNRPAAIQQYESCRRILHEELGIAPSPETTLLYEQIKAGTLERMSRSGDGVLAAARREGNLPAVSRLYGRQAELAQLEKWLMQERCQLITVAGMGGLGKTAVAAATAAACARHFDLLLWRSLLNAPPLDEILRDWLKVLSPEGLSSLPESLDARLALLLQQLRNRRCLLVLDNLESIFQAGQAGQVRPEFDGYARLLQQVAEAQHRSCLLLTSREQVQSLARLEEDLPWVRTLRLEGLDAAATRTLLVERDLSLQSEHADVLSNRYSGNPLALKLVTETIQDLFAGDVAAFLASEAVIFDDIRAVLDQQFSRLSPLEQEILVWLAVEREPLSLENLRDNLAPARPAPEVVQALRALQRRSLLQRANRNQSESSVYPAGLWTDMRFASPNVVMEYLVDRLVQTICEEVEQEEPRWLHTYALIQARTKEYVLQSQMRLILQPLATRVEARLGRHGVGQKAAQILHALAAERFPRRGYAAGNLLNLLLRLDLDISTLYLAGLSVWQADLRQANLAGINLAGADLSRSRFADAFGTVYTVVISPDGTILAAGDSRGEIRLWDIATGQMVHTYRGHTAIVRSLTFRPDGRVLASGSDDQTVRLWMVKDIDNLSPDLASFAHILAGHTGRVTAIAFHPDGHTLASASVDSTIRVWDVTSGETKARLQGHEDSIWTIAISPDGYTLASGGIDRTIRCWDLRTATLCKTIREHGHLVSAVAFDPTGTWLVSASYDYTMCLWDVASMQKIYSLRAGDDFLTTVAFSPNGELIASGGDDHSIRLWETRTGKLSRQFDGHSDAVHSVAFSPDGQTLASGGVDQAICLWDLPMARIRRFFSGYSRATTALAYHPNSKLLASAHIDRVVRLWDPDSQEVRQILHGHTLPVVAVNFSRDGSLLATSSDDKSIHVWAISAEGNARRRYELRGHRLDVTSLAFHPDGKTLFSTSKDQTVALWNMENGQLRRFIQASDIPLWSVKINPAGTVVAVLSDRNIRLLDMASGRLYKELPGHAPFIWALDYSPDGHWLASGGSDGSIALWDVRDPVEAELKHTLRGHDDRVFRVAFHPEGTLLAAGSADHTISVWNMQTHQLVHRLRGHTHWLGTVIFSPDGRTIASGSLDETIRLWDSQSGESLGVLYVPGPYEGMNISGVTGISEAEKEILKSLGAVEE